MSFRIAGSKPKPGVSYQKVERYTYEEFEKSCQEKGFLSDAISLQLWDFTGYSDPEYVIIKSLVSIADRGIYGIRVKDYEVIGSEGQNILLNVTLVRREN